MKKVIALVMCIAMIACFAVTASAADAINVTVSSHKDAKVGDVIPVTVSLPSDFADDFCEIGALTVTIKLDDEYLEPAFTKKGPKNIWCAEGAVIDYSGATLMSSDGYDPATEKYVVTIISVDGLYVTEGADLFTIYVKVKAELPEAGAAVDMEIAECAHYEQGLVDAVAVDGLIKGVEKAPVQPPVGGGEQGGGEQGGGNQGGGNQGGTEGTKPVDTDTDTDSKNPGTGDATGIAVAAGLCAVMAAAFVITKKVND